MEITIYNSLPECARAIRQAVFVEEQGFQEEFDETDAVAVHLMAFDGERPAGTCRVFRDGQMGSYILGRLAVVKEYRGKGLGSRMLQVAEEYVREQGGEQLALHAQCQAAAFYEKQGFAQSGGIEEEQGCPHIWMKKRV